MANQEDWDFSASIKITPISPTNKTHLVVNIEGMSLVLHLESWDSYLHIEAIKKFDQMLNELRAAQQTISELRAAHSIPTSSSSS